MIKKFIKVIVILLIAIPILVLLYSIQSVSAKLNNVKVTKLYVELESAVGNNSLDFSNPDREVDGYLNLGYKMNIGKYLYNESIISSIITSAQFRRVSLDMEFGGRIIDGLDLYVRHKSSHTLDYVGFIEQFPQENSVGIRFTLVGE